MHITALAGGVGGARFLRGLRAHLDAHEHLADATLTVIANTGDDITLFGLRVCPDLDTLLYTLGGVVHEEQGWGRDEESRTVQGELAAYGAAPDWFALGDRDLGAHIVRSQWLGQGRTLSEVTATLAGRWDLAGRGITLLPMSDDPVETHVVVADAATSAGGAGGAGRGGSTAMHFQEWWVRHHAQLPVERFVAVGMDRARPAPGVLEAIRGADVVLLPPSNPVVSIGIILLVPGVREALRETSAPVVGVAPLVGGRPVRGYADACLRGIGVPATAAGVAGLYADFLDGWLVATDEAPGTDWPAGLLVRERPLLMTDRAAAADLAGAALDLGLSLREPCTTAPAPRA